MASLLFTNRFLIHAFFFSVPVLMAVGCSEQTGIPRSSVEGEVKIDGKTIDLGSITFHSKVGSPQLVAGGSIENGRYRILEEKGPTIGANRIEIRASTGTGKRVPDPYGRPGDTIEETVDIVPSKFNDDSVLEREIMPGNNVLDLNLETQ